MPQFNDDLYATLRGLGYSGALNDMLFAYLGAQGHSGSLDDRLFLFFRAAGYTGSFTDMYAQWRALGYPLASGPVPFDPISLFTAGGGTGTGRLYDPVKTPSTLYSDAGTTLAGIGDTVYRILDRTGGGDSDQVTAASRGIRAADGIIMDGVDDFYPTGLAVSGNDFTVVASAFVDSAAGATSMLFGGDQNGTNRLMNYLPAVNTFGFAAGSSARTTATDVRNTTVFSVIIRSGGGSVEGRLNGAAAYATEAAPALTAVTAQHWGCRNNNGTAGNFLRGRLRGLLIINRALTNTELTNVQTYWS